MFQQSCLIRLTPAMQAAQEPRPLDRAICHDHKPVAERKIEADVVKRQERCGFAGGHITLYMGWLIAN